MKQTVCCICIIFMWLFNPTSQIVSQSCLVHHINFVMCVGLYIICLTSGLFVWITQLCLLLILKVSGILITHLNILFWNIHCVKIWFNSANFENICILCKSIPSVLPKTVLLQNVLYLSCSLVPQPTAQNRFFIS